MTATLPYPPSTNNLYWTVGKRRVLTKQGRQFKAAAAAMALAAGMRPIAGEVAVKIELYRPRRAGDIDNSLKSCFDALKGIAWHDDAQVKRIEAERFEDKSNPRAVVTVEALTGQLFKNDAAA